MSNEPLLTPDTELVNPHDCITCMEMGKEYQDKCNCSWTQNTCCWCGKEFGEETEDRLKLFAGAILKIVDKSGISLPDINTLLAELEPYPDYIIRIDKVK